MINVDDIESIDLLKNRCCFISAYGAALYEIVSQDVLKYELEGSSAQFLVKPIAVLRNSIVCFDCSECKVSEGDVLVAVTRHKMMPFRSNPILSIEINNIRHKSIDISAPTKFGLAVSYRAHEKYEYCVLPRGTV